MTRLLDTITGARLRGRLANSMWLIGAVLGVVYFREHSFSSAVGFASVFMVSVLAGWILGALVALTVGCPRCGKRLLWEDYNHELGVVPSPYEAKRCPACGFDPG